MTQPEVSLNTVALRQLHNLQPLLGSSTLWQLYHLQPLPLVLVGTAPLLVPLVPSKAPHLQLVERPGLVPPEDGCQEDDRDDEGDGGHQDDGDAVEDIPGGVEGGDGGEVSAATVL